LKIAIKPDGVQRGLVGTVISRFEQKGYKLINIKVQRKRQKKIGVGSNFLQMVTPTAEFAGKHYADLSGMNLLEEEFMSS
jgi:nucleoside diphosphate kinase